jgi:hypothetical protein
MKRWLTRGEEDLSRTVRDGGVLGEKYGHKMALIDSPDSHLFFRDLTIRHRTTRFSPMMMNRTALLRLTTPAA